MTWTRFISICLLLLALGLAGWSGWHAAQTQRTSSSDVVLLLPRAELPALNPFLPADESERQILDLIHEPLLRIDREGRLATALAEQWKWHQHMTCWFDSAEAARAAALELRDQPMEKRAMWDLDTVVTQGESLIVRFTRPESAVAAEVQAVLAASNPAPLTFVRINAPLSARFSLEAFARHTDHAASTKRLWFDEDGTCEIVTTRTGVQAQQALIEWLGPRHSPVPEIIPLVEVAALLEPVLDFRLKPDLRWPSGSPISAADVRATLAYVMPRPWPVAGRDAFRQIQAIDEPEPGLVRIIYRKSYSPALAAWTTLPILSHEWLSRIVSEFTQAPPGAGVWQVDRKEGARMWLKKRTSTGKAGVEPRIQMLASTSALQARIGIATKSFDVACTAGLPREILQAESSMRALTTPARHQIMLVWNTLSKTLDQANVRRAFGMALDREALRLSMPGGLGRAHHSFFPPGFWFSSTHAPSPPVPAEAERLFASAGWLKDIQGHLKRGAEEMRLRLVIPDGNADRQRLALALAQQWGHLGIGMDIVEVPARSYLMELQAGRFDAALVGGELAPGWDVLPFWHSAQSGGHGLNVSQIADPQLDLLLEALMSEFDPAEIPRRAAAVEARLRDLQPALPLFTDLTEVSVRAARFPGLSRLDSTRGITLQDLLSATSEVARPQTKLQMLPPE
jgi:ABC-type transport system substrate-binding protein